MTRRQPQIRTAPTGIEAAWPRPGHNLTVIYLADYLDEVTRCRYIQQALAEHGIEPRHGALLPLTLTAGIEAVRNALRGHRATSTAAALSVLTAGGLTFAAVHDNKHMLEHPSEAALAPHEPASQPSTRPHKPVPSPSSPPKTRPFQTPVKQPAPATPTSLMSTIGTITATPRLPIPRGLSRRLPAHLPIPRDSDLPGRPTITPPSSPSSLPEVRPARLKAEVRVTSTGVRVYLRR